MDIVNLRDQLKQSGRVWLRHAVPEEELRKLTATMKMDARAGTRIARGDALFRNIHGSSWAKDIAAIWYGCSPVRVVSFDKSPELNWGVPWHQDRVVAVKDRVETPGFSNWSKKAGIWHCEPPLKVLQRMLFVRVHLDRNFPGNGAMEIALESHKAGRINSSDAAQASDGYTTEICTADPGDILILRMLTLHRSKPSRTTASRKVLRIDFSADHLPAPLEWA